ncbi:MAG: S8 family peptidase [Chitinophagaceae bacterium]
MKKLLPVPFLLVLFFSGAQAQFTRYVVRLKHKGATSYSLSNPSPYLSPRAIARRVRYNIPVDSTDLPVPAAYISQLRSIPNVIILNTSRWLNAVSILTTDAAAITAINALPFVQGTSGIAGRRTGRSRGRIESTPLSRHNRVQQVQADYFDYGTGASYDEIHLHQGEFLHNVGLRGQGMQIAMLDGGFFQYTAFDAFDSANANGQFLSTWDFVANEQSVVEDLSHGMSCLSTIVANIPGMFIGKAPKASFHLFRTEDGGSEYPIEEFNWACGAERADSVGADIISSSLGYGYEFNPPVPDYPYSDLNGDITMSARAADLAAQKGLLVFNSAGNSGTDHWRMITTPADADSILAVGAVNSAGNVGAFSSYGPSADGRIKPDVASVGVAAVIQTASNTIGLTNGTSLACPNMAGLGTCLWQGFPEFNNMRIVRALREAGSIYNAPDDRIGYGIPDMKKAFSVLLAEFATATATLNACTITLNWTSKDIRAMKYEIEKKAPGDPAYSKIGQTDPMAGTILANHSYQFSHKLDTMPAGTIAYRIRQVIDTNAATFTAVYIDTVQVAVATPCMPDTKVLIAPNPPAGNNARLMVQTSYAVTDLQITVYDMKGSLVLQMARSKPVGTTFFELATAAFAKGQYIVRVFNHAKVIGTTELLKL